MTFRCPRCGLESFVGHGQPWRFERSCCQVEWINEQYEKAERELSWMVRDEVLWCENAK
jgi:hypothetical protein